MNHLNETTSIQVRDYFKDKIDWKLYNFILDKITKYEDMGINCAVYVYIPGLKENKVYTNPQKVYSYSNGHGGFETPSKSLRKLISYYENRGICYSALVDDYHEMQNFKKELIHPEIEEVIEAKMTRYLYLKLKGSDINRNYVRY